MTYTSIYRKIKVRASELLTAQKRAAATTDDWQARLIEYLLIPKLNKRWLEANGDHYAMLILERHPGQPYRAKPREDNLAIGERKGWAEFAGYTLRYGEHLCWNMVREDYYGHSASTCWNGIRRETYCGFVDALDAWIYAVSHKKCLADCGNDVGASLVRYNIEVQDDVNYELPKRARKGKS